MVSPPTLLSFRNVKTSLLLYQFNNQIVMFHTQKNLFGFWLVQH